MAEGAPLLREYTLIAYRGFESLLLRHFVKQYGALQPIFCAVPSFMPSKPTSFTSSTLGVGR